MHPITTTPLPPDEWDFYDCPEDKVYFCFTYEYARQIDWIRNLYFDARKNHPEQFDKNGNWHYVIQVLAPQIFAIDIETPEDNEQLPIVHTYTEPGVQDIEVIDAPVGFPDIPYLQVAENHKITNDSWYPIVRESTSSILSVPIQDRLVVPSDDDNSNLYAIKIDWQASPSQIIRDFENWLEGKRPSESQPKENRGTKNFTVHYFARLKALGALRLYKHFRSMQYAREFAQKHGKLDSYYASENKWREAKRKAQAYIDSFLTIPVK